jgi:hypothetical protein
MLRTDESDAPSVTLETTPNLETDPPAFEVGTSKSPRHRSMSYHRPRKVRSGPSATYERPTDHGSEFGKHHAMGLTRSPRRIRFCVPAWVDERTVMNPPCREARSSLDPLLPLLVGADDEHFERMITRLI